MTINVGRKKNGLPYLNKNNIEEITQLHLEKFNSDLLKEPLPIPIEEFLQNHLKLEMDYADITCDISILGLTTFDSGHLRVHDSENNKERVIYVEEGTVIIDNSLLEDDQEGRLRFTYGHEGGHWIFHREMFQLNKKQINNPDMSIHKQIKTAKCLYRCSENDLVDKKFTTDEEWMEWQANYTSSCLLMPRKTFIMAVQKILKEANIKEESIILGKDPDIDVFAEHHMPKKMADIFKVSMQAASIRLKELKLINHIKYTKGLSIVFLLMQLREAFIDDFYILDILSISYLT